MQAPNNTTQDMSEEKTVTEYVGIFDPNIMKQVISIKVINHTKLTQGYTQ